VEQQRRDVFFISGFCEALGALLTLVALTTARVVIVSPIVATTPLFSLVISLLFLRGKEQVTRLTIIQKWRWLLVRPLSRWEDKLVEAY